MKRYDVIAIGELNVDLIMTGLKNMPVPGREIIAEKGSLVLGSSTAICASGLARLGLKTAFMGKVGRDDFGRTVLEALQNNGIDTSMVITDGNIRTGITVSLSTPNDRALATYLGSIESLDRDDINLEAVSSSRHIHIGSYFLQHRLRPYIPELFSWARNNGITTSLDAGWDESENWDYGISDALKYTDIFLPNETEALNIAGKDNVNAAIEVLSEYTGIVAVKCGSKGAVGKWNGRVIAQEPFDLKPVDTTGAGDSFNAGFIYGFLKGYDLRKCMTYGNACGSISVTRIGGASSCATLEEVKRLAGE